MNLLFRVEEESAKGRIKLINEPGSAAGSISRRFPSPYARARPR